MLKFLSISSNFLFYLFKNKIIYYFVKFMVSKKWRTTNFFLLLFLVFVSSEIRDPGWKAIQNDHHRASNWSTKFFFRSPWCPSVDLFSGSSLFLWRLIIADPDLGDSFYRKSSVADPGCLSQIPDPTCFHPGSRRIRIFSIPDPHKRISVF